MSRDPLAAVIERALLHGHTDDWSEEMRGDAYEGPMQSRPRPTPRTATARGDPEPTRLAVTSCDTIEPEPVRWLVQGYIPLGKLVMIAGEGGEGKSTMTVGMAADITRGDPCFGLHYDPPPPSDVLLITCEDDFADTVVPRLAAAGANRKRVFRVDGVENPRAGHCLSRSCTTRRSKRS